MYITVHDHNADHVAQSIMQCYRGHPREETTKHRRGYTTTQESAQVQTVPDPNQSRPRSTHQNGAAQSRRPGCFPCRHRKSGRISSAAADHILTLAYAAELGSSSFAMVSVIKKNYKKGTSHSRTPPTHTHTHTSFRGLGVDRHDET